VPRLLLEPLELELLLELMELELSRAAGCTTGSSGCWSRWRAERRSVPGSLAVLFEPPTDSVDAEHAIESDSSRDSRQEVGQLCELTASVPGFVAPWRCLASYGACGLSIDSEQNAIGQRTVCTPRSACVVRSVRRLESLPGWRA
jgi:hypothetical protein